MRVEQASVIRGLVFAVQMCNDTKLLLLSILLALRVMSTYCVDVSYIRSTSFRRVYFLGWEVIEVDALLGLSPGPIMVNSGDQV